MTDINIEKYKGINWVRWVKIESKCLAWSKSFTRIIINYGNLFIMVYLLSLLYLIITICYYLSLIIINLF